MKHHIGVERSFVWWIAVGEIYSGNIAKGTTDPRVEFI